VTSDRQARLAYWGLLVAFLVVLLGALVLIHAARAVAPPEPVREPWSPHRYVATIDPEDVHDGDTVTATIATDFGVSVMGRIRIAGLDAPELHGATRAAGEAARDHLAGLLDGRPVFLEVLTTRTGRPVRSFERVVARVWIERDGRLVDVAGLMIADGFGVAFREIEP
jgi:endonuclease YncB( thermonuclease family)